MYYEVSFQNKFIQVKQYLGFKKKVQLNDSTINSGYGKKLIMKERIEKQRLRDL